MNPKQYSGINPPNYYRHTGEKTKPVFIDMENFVKNIIIVSIKLGPEWRDFSWEEYYANCDHIPQEEELIFFNEFLISTECEPLDNSSMNLSRTERFISGFILQF